MHNHRFTYRNGIRTLAALTLAATWISGCARDNDNNVTNERALPVRVDAAAAMMFKRELQLIGTLESVRFALVPAEVGETIEKILVNEGDAVKQGQPLCVLDRANLQRIAESQEQELSVAKNALSVSMAQEEQARANNQLTEKDIQRFRRLAQQDVVSQRQLDEAERNATITAAAHKVALAQVDLARARVRQAETALAIARHNLEDATICAPIAGVISVRYRELGELVRMGDPVFRIDDPSEVEVSAFAPAGSFREVVPGKTPLYITVNGQTLSPRPVSYRSPTIDQNLRTFEIKARIAQPPAGVVAGAMVNVTVALQERKGTGVPASAVLTRNGQPVVFTVEADKARQAVVKTGLRTDGFIEILEGLPAGAPVITLGQNLVNDGSPVTRVEEK